ncbi:hypothetical protein ABPG72_022419 [Tetrahymena utriculariae]
MQQFIASSNIFYCSQRMPKLLRTSVLFGFIYLSYFLIVLNCLIKHIHLSMKNSQSNKNIFKFRIQINCLVLTINCFIHHLFLFVIKTQIIMSINVIWFNNQSLFLILKQLHLVLIDQNIQAPYQKVQSSSLVQLLKIYYTKIWSHHIFLNAGKYMLAFLKFLRFLALFIKLFTCFGWPHQTFISQNIFLLNSKYSWQIQDLFLRHFQNIQLPYQRFQYFHRLNLKGSVIWMIQSQDISLFSEIQQLHHQFQYFYRSHPDLYKLFSSLDLFRQPILTLQLIHLYFFVVHINNLTFHKHQHNQGLFLKLYQDIKEIHQLYLNQDKNKLS